MRTTRGTDAGAAWGALAGQTQHAPAVGARFRAEVTTPQRERERAPFIQFLDLASGAVTRYPEVASIQRTSGPSGPAASSAANDEFHRRHASYR